MPLTLSGVFVRGLFTINPMTKAESIAYLRKLALKEKLSEDFLPARNEGVEEVFRSMEDNKESNADAICPQGREREVSRM